MRLLGVFSELPSHDVHANERRWYTLPEENNEC